MLFYYEEIYNAAIERINKLVNISGNIRNSLFNRLTTLEDIDQVMQRSMHSSGTILCPDAIAEYAGFSKLLELDMADDKEDI
jgi:hypothetical protein